jgi:endonuclease/exonuclease/phosphatase family metal-dependent hydrolase
VDTLRIATLNLWNKSGPWPARKARIVEELLHLQPDLLGLQELLRIAPDAPAAPGSEALERPRSLTAGAHTVELDPHAPWAWHPDNDQLTELAQALVERGGARAELLFVEAKSFGGGLVMGNGLMTRFPVLVARGFRLPGEESGESRSLLYALLDTPAGRLPTFVTHLNWKWHHGAVRVRQVQAIVEHMEALHPWREEPVAGELPPVLLGDFNAEPESDEIRFLRGLHTLDGKSVHFADCWAWAGSGGPGYTFDRANAFAARSNEPPRRIDYVFVRGPDAWLRGEPRRTQLAFTEPEPSSGDATALVWPSDHYGLVAELSVAPRRGSQ